VPARGSRCAPKQRHTIKRIAERLIDEYGANVKYETVRDYVTPRRAQIEAETAPVPESASGFVSRHHHPSQDAEVDFGEVWVLIDGTLVHCHMLILRLCYSGKAVHRAFHRTSDQDRLQFATTDALVRQ
jgi:hypothetical protein